MKTKLKLLAVLLLLSTVNHPLSTAFAQGTAFTYQGRLAVGGNSSTNGSYDFQFQVFDTAPVNTGTSYGSPNPNSVNGVAVSNGLFTVTLNFGTGVFTGPDRWLQIFVRTNGNGAYTTLSPRQPLTPTPYAIYSGNAAQLGGQASTAYVAKAGDTMTGALNLPANGLIVGGTQLVSSGGKVGIGTASLGGKLSIFNNTSSEPLLKIEDSRDDTFFSRYLSKESFYDTGGEAAYVGLEHNFGEGPAPRAMLFGLSADGNPATEKMRITRTGSVGIGTANPTAKLDVRPIAFANNQSGGIQLATTTGQYASGMFLRTDNNGFPRLAFDISSGEGLCIQAGGSVGIGTSFAQTMLDIRPIAFANNQSGGIQLACTDDHYRSGMYLRTDSGGFPHLDLDGPSVVGALSIIGSGYVGIGTYLPQSALDVRGTTTTCVLTITGGCDLSEPFEMSSKDIPNGAIVIIDDERPGVLKVSQRAYDTRVAGIVSGANGVKPGISMSQQGVIEGGQNVALSGRVYALADAFYGAIKPGDLLTTSDTPGHCMKVTNHPRAQGAIIGKAMSSLEKGKGMVLVLVSLQ